MNILARKTIETDVLEDVLCDCCGESCNMEYRFEFASLKATRGHSSRITGDKWNDVFCDKCAIEILQLVLSDI